METDYVFLVEKKAMWAKMLIQLLKENQIPYTTLPVYGAGLCMKAGVQERLKIYVPKENAVKAAALCDELFSEDEA